MAARTLKDRIESASRRLAWAGPLLARLSVGAVFAVSGWGKLNDLESVTAFFTELGIPAPGVQAVVVSLLELTGGVAMMLGLLTRVAVLPLIGVMAVAIGTARRDEIGSPLDLLSFEEFTYIAVFVWLAVAGAGAVSLDGLLTRLRSRRGDEDPGSMDPVRA